MQLLPDTKIERVSMARPKGQPKIGGRKPGTPNKSTANAREAIARLVDGNAERMQGWLDEIAAEQGAEKAFHCLMDVMEYHVPKLARTEHTGKDGEDQTLVVKVIRE